MRWRCCAIMATPPPAEGGPHPPGGGTRGQRPRHCCGPPPSARTLPEAAESQGVCHPAPGADRSHARRASVSQVSQDFRRSGVAPVDPIPSRTYRISGDKVGVSSQFRPNFVTTSPGFRQVFCLSTGYILEQYMVNRVHVSDRLCHRTTMVIGTGTKVPLPGGIFGVPGRRQARAAEAAALRWEWAQARGGARYAYLN